MSLQKSLVRGAKEKLQWRIARGKISRKNKKKKKKILKGNTKYKWKAGKKAAEIYIDKLRHYRQFLQMIFISQKYEWKTKTFYLYISAICSYNVRPDSLKHQFVSWIFTMNGIYGDPFSGHWEVWSWISQNENITLGHCHLQ